MQVRRTTGRHKFFEPLLERCSARQPAGHNVASQRLGFHDRDIRLTRDWDEIIRRTSLHPSRAPEMEWQSDLMHRFSIQLQRLHAPTNECSRFNRAPQTYNRNVIAIPDPQLALQVE